MPQDRKRVVWFEGMGLDPHHFQQWDRYAEGALHARIRSIAPYDWGVSDLEIDRERLANGEFVIARCRGVMPDGLYFDIPESDDPPTPRNVQDFFAATQDRLAVFLAVPVERTDGGNILLQDGENRRETRFLAQTISVQDENTGTTLRQVEVVRSNMQLRFGDEPLREYSTIQVAEVRRSPSGTFVLNDQFVPTCLSLGASERLVALTRRLIELLVTKSTSLMERRRGMMNLRELSPADIQALGLLNTVNAYIPLLNHYHTNTELHPEALFRTLLGLGGQLTAGLPEAGIHPRTFPTYDHAALSTCFNRIDVLLLEMLGEAVVSANYTEIPLEPIRPNFFQALIDAEWLDKGQFYLVARSQDLGEQQLIAELPTKIRVASPENIYAVVDAAVTALPIEHTHRLPAALPVDGQANYFQVLKRGPFWEPIKNSGTLAVYIPDEFSKINLKLVAVLSP